MASADILRAASEPATITINTNYGPDEIDALKCGELACHRGVGEHHDRWVITHIPTGLSLSSRGTFAGKKAAVAAMEEVASKGDWADMGTPNRQALGKMVAEVFAKHLRDDTPDQSASEQMLDALQVVRRSAAWTAFSEPTKDLICAAIAAAEAEAGR